MPTTWNGSLSVNELFVSIFNMIIGQEVYSKNVGDMFSSLVNRARIDGTMLGDTYLKYSTDALATNEFDPTGLLNNGQQANVLEQHRPKDPFVQAITIDTFRQIPITIDHYFTKRAFSTDSAFADFNSVTLQWLRDTKRIYDATTYNVFVGSTVPGTASQKVKADIVTVAANASAAEKEATRRTNALIIAKTIADLMVKIKDVSKDYNDLGYYRAFDPSDLMIIWNADWVNELRKMDLPTVFHKDGLLEIKEENILPAKYFGYKSGPLFSASTIGRALVEQSFTYSGTNYHLWPGEIMPANHTTLASVTGYEGQYTAVANASTAPATVPDSIICKIIHKRSIPYMSGFETETEFINPKLLNENHYLTFGHNTLQYLYNYPMIAVYTGTTP